MTLSVLVTDGNSARAIPPVTSSGGVMERSESQAPGGLAGLPLSVETLFPLGVGRYDPAVLHMPSMFELAILLALLAVPVIAIGFIVWLVLWANKRR